MVLAVLQRKKKIKGGAIVARLLAAEGVSKVFGIIDGTYFGFYTSLGPLGIDLVSPRNEACAVHMAAAHARLTGKLGVCMASNGPGVAAVLPGVAVENAEANRVLLITSCRRSGISYPERSGTFQYFPQIEVTRPMTKWSCAVPTFDRVAELTRQALRICFSGRPGVVHLDIPESIMNGSFDLDPGWFREPSSYRQVEPLTPNSKQLQRAVELLAQAKRPLIHAGSGVLHAGASAELQQLAEQICAPLTTSWAGRCAVDERHGHSLAMPYLDAVRRARNEADLVLVLGSRLGETDWWGKAPYWAKPDKQKLIQVDIDPEVFGTVRPVELPVLADIKAFLQGLSRLLREQPNEGLEARNSWLQDLKRRARKRRAQLDAKLDDNSSPLHSAHVARICREELADDAVLVIDGGNTAVWSNFFHEVRTPGALLSTPKMGMLGAGTPQALGASASFPGRQVYCITGDGAMAYHLRELETAVRNKLPVIFLVLCDKQWGMVKMNQQFALKPVKTLLMKSLGPDETINADFEEIRFDALARAFGAHGERVADPAGLRCAIRRSLEAGRTAVIHVDVDPVKHMWAPHLKDFKDMHAEPKG